MDASTRSLPCPLPPFLVSMPPCVTPGTSPLPIPLGLDARPGGSCCIFGRRTVAAACAQAAGVRRPLHTVGQIGLPDDVPVMASWFCAEIVPDDVDEGVCSRSAG